VTNESNYKKIGVLSLVGDRLADDIVCVHHVCVCMIEEHDSSKISEQSADMTELSSSMSPTLKV